MTLVDFNLESRSNCLIQIISRKKKWRILIFLKKMFLIIGETVSLITGNFYSIIR